MDAVIQEKNNSSKHGGVVTAENSWFPDVVREALYIEQKRRLMNS